MSLPPILEDLIQILAETIPEKENSYTVVDEVEMSCKYVKLKDIADDNWRKIVVEAHSQNKVGEIIEYVRERYPINDENLTRIKDVYKGPRVSEFHERLSKVTMIHDELQEWKEIHWHLDGLLTTSRSFTTFVEGLPGTNTIGVERDLAKSLNPVAQRMGALLEWLPQIKIIEIVRWEGNLKSLYAGLEDHLSTISNVKGRLISRRTQKEWLVGLSTLSSGFESEIITEMNHADNMLREQAKKLSETLKGV